MRTDKRFWLTMLAANVLLFALIFSPWNWLDSGCDADCQGVADDFMRENAPELFISPTPFNPDRFIDDILKDRP